MGGIKGKINKCFLFIAIQYHNAAWLANNYTTIAYIFILWYYSCMVYSHIEKKQLKIVLLAYLVLALIGSSAISAGEAFSFDYSNNDSIYSGRYFSSISHTFDWLVGDILTIRKTNNFSNSPIRNRSLRVFTLAGTIATAICLVGTNLQTFYKDNNPAIKNFILLRLRIWTLFI